MFSVESIFNCRLDGIDMLDFDGDQCFQLLIELDENDYHYQPEWIEESEQDFPLALSV